MRQHQQIVVQEIERMLGEHGQGARATMKRRGSLRAQPAASGEILPVTGVVTGHQPDCVIENLSPTCKAFCDYRALEPAD